MAPVKGVWQTIPVAELYAALLYVLNVNDEPNRCYHFMSDCAWVVDSFQKGPSETTGGQHVHADLWKRLHDANDRRRYPISIIKVKSHVTKAEVDAGYPENLRVGNGLADAAAKIALTLHPMSQEVVDEIDETRAVVKMVAKYTARCTAKVFDDADDYYPTLWRTKRKEAADYREELLLAVGNRHVGIPDGDGIRCI